MREKGTALKFGGGLNLNWVPFHACAGIVMPQLLQLLAYYVSALCPYHMSTFFFHTFCPANFAFFVHDLCSWTVFVSQPWGIQHKTISNLHIWKTDCNINKHCVILFVTCMLLILNRTTINWCSDVYESIIFALLTYKTENRKTKELTTKWFSKTMKTNGLKSMVF